MATARTSYSRQAWRRCAGIGAASKRRRTFPNTPILWIELLRHDARARLPVLGDVVSIHYSCLLAHSGTVVDSSRSKPLGTRQPLKVQIGTCQLVRGLEHALLMLSVGTLARVYVPAVLAYADEQVGQIAPGSDLVFEVEMQMIGDKLAPPLPQSHIRERFMLPPSAPPAMTFARGNVARERGSAQSMEMMEAALADSMITEHMCISHIVSGTAPMITPQEATYSDNGSGGVERMATLPPQWVQRLCPQVPLPAAEARAFDAFFARRLGSDEAVCRAAAVAETSARLLPGARSVRRQPYGALWDSSSPLVLSGDPSQCWPPIRWGWDVLSPGAEESHVLAKQRAPILPCDDADSILVAESTLAEYLRYARSHHHELPTAGQAPPVLYMNGWDLFTARPGLWAAAGGVAAMECALGASVRSLSKCEFARHFSRHGLSDSTSRLRQLCKLFIGPRGAITRMHRDNHHAHAWLTQLEGYKLYVLCAPWEAAKAKVEPEPRGTMPPLDPLEAPPAVLQRLHALILSPGETLLIPDGWWHYAASLTPNMTLMCNFWDEANVKGLHDMFRGEIARAIDKAHKEACFTRHRCRSSLSQPLHRHHTHPRLL